MRVELVCERLVFYDNKYMLVGKYKLPCHNYINTIENCIRLHTNVPDLNAGRGSIIFYEISEKLYKRIIEIIGRNFVWFSKVISNFRITYDIDLELYYKHHMDEHIAPIESIIIKDCETTVDDFLNFNGGLLDEG